MELAARMFQLEKNQYFYSKTKVTCLEGRKW